jgi:PAS domain S-box-containing protein
MSGLTTSLDAKLLLTRRGDSGALEEGYFDFTLLPIIQKSGITDGVLEIAIDRTKVVLAYRRMNTLGKLSKSLKTIHDFDDEFWKRVVMAFDDNPMDSPVLILYRTARDTDDSVQLLQRVIGVKPGGDFAPYICSDQTPAGIFQDDMQNAKERNAVVLRQFPQGVLNSEELNSRGIGENPSAAAVIPIQVSPKVTYGFLILGINPLRPMERSYKHWLDSIQQELAAAATGVWFRQQEISRVINMQNHGPIKEIVFNLKSQVSQRTEALRRSELLFTQTSETLPVGLMLVDLKGRIFFANHTARKMFRAKCDKELNAIWREHIYHEDRPQLLTAFDNAIREKKNVQIQHRIGNREPERGWEYWVSSSIVVQVDERTGQVSR